MNKLIAIDAMLFVWGIKNLATPGQEDKIFQTQALLNTLQTEGYQIIIPAPVLAEGLAPVPVYEQATIMAKMNKYMRIAPFDTVAALKFGEMMHDYISSMGKEEVKRYLVENNLNKHAMKFDFMIAAIAVAQKAHILYSDDKHVHKFAKRFIDVINVPKIIVPHSTGAKQLSFIPEPHEQEHEEQDQ